MGGHQPYTYIAGRTTSYSVDDMFNKGLCALESAAESILAQEAGDNGAMEDGPGAEAAEEEEEEEPEGEAELAAYRDADEELHPDMDDIGMDMDM